MPKFNGTGPMGNGSMTGRGLGPCGCGMRMGWAGRGWGLRRFRADKTELEYLENEEKMLMEELEELRAEKEALKSQE